MRVQLAGMSQVAIDVRAAGVVELLLDRRAMGLWESLRRAGSPVNIAQLGRRSGLSQPAVQECMDALVAMGLVRRMPAAGRRRTTTYRCTCDSILVRGDLHDVQDAALFRRYYDGLRVVNDRILGGSDFVDLAATPGALTFYYAAPVELSETEATELRRRMREVAAFLKMVQDKHVGPRARPSAMCSHYAHFRVQPLREPQMAQPEIRIVPRTLATREQPITGGAMWGRLSPREREIALALAAGSTQPEIARRLGVSHHTVGTFAKRIHAKLGIRRRAELVNAIRSLAAAD